MSLDWLNKHLRRSSAIPASRKEFPLSDTARKELSWFLDERWYRKQVIDLAPGFDAVVSHYLTQGIYEGRQPNLLFDPGFYAAQLPEPLGLPEAISHYLEHLNSSQTSTHVLFEAARYAARIGSIPRQGLLHDFLTRGRKLRYSPHILFEFDVASSQIVSTDSSDELEHFLEHGNEECITTHPLFRPEFYLEKNSDIKKGSQNPLFHYLQFGYAEGRDPHPLFQVNQYLDSDAHIRMLRINPLIHFLDFGWRERRWPNVAFDTSYYMERYPERLHENPLIDYIVDGAAKGARPIFFFDTVGYRKRFNLENLPAWQALAVFLERGIQSGHSADDLIPTDLYLTKDQNGSKLRADLRFARRLRSPELVAAGEAHMRRSASLQPANLPKREELKGKRVVFYFPQPSPGSGGHRTLLDAAVALSHCGCQVEVFCPCSASDLGGRTLQAAVEEWFGSYPLKFVQEKAPSMDADLYFATFWDSPAYLRSIGIAKEKIAYFVQDFEPWFYPMSEPYLQALRSYSLVSSCITIGTWLTHKLTTELKISSSAFPFGADTTIYGLLPEVKRKQAVCFVHQPEKPRRCTSFGLRALNVLKKLKPEVEIIIFGSTNPAYDLTVEHLNLGVLSPWECAVLYNTCEVGLCLSASNPSRVPFEMMACGLPVVDLDVENNRFDYPDFGVLLAEFDEEAVAGAILSLLNDRGLQERHKTGGLEYMQGRTKTAELEGFVELVAARLRKP